MVERGSGESNLKNRELLSFKSCKVGNNYPFFYYGAIHILRNTI